MNALIVTDVQNDFTPATDDKPAGALAVADGNAVVPVINQLMPRFELVVATQDWHPPGHKSFASQHPGRRIGEVIEWKGLQQILWPDHCVQNTPGADFVPGLNLDHIDHIVHKATDPDIDSYSAFYDNGHRKATGLGDYLNDQGVRDLYIAGIATDFCVKFSVLDARQLGFNVHVVRDACRAVNLQPDDEQKAVDQMVQAGAKVITSREVLERR